MSLTAVQPAYLTVPERAGTYADEAIDLSTLYGRVLDGSQCLALDALMSHDAQGNWATLETVAIAPRQNGKTAGIILPMVMADLFLFNADRIVWTAHLFKTARDAFRDVKRAIDSTPELSRRVKRISDANGEEGVELHSGALLEFLARSKGGGRGLGGKRLVLDEALFLLLESTDALIPILAARPNAQINYASSAGVATSEALRELRDRGRRHDPDLAYVEWCADGSFLEPGCVEDDCDHSLRSEGCRLDDPEQLAKANMRIDLDFLRKSRKAMAPEGYAREFLGWWSTPSGLGTTVIPAELWTACQDPASKVTDPVFAVDVAPDQSWAAIVAAGSSGDRTHVEITSRKGQMDHRPGMDWIVPRLVEIKAQRVVMEKRSAAASLAPLLEQAGIEVEYLTTEQVGQACAALFSQVVERTLVHLGQPELDRAVANAARRDIGDGAWAWSRRKSSIDISPLYAATLAAWVHTTVGTFSPGIYFL